MIVTEAGRHELLELYGRFYGEQHFAVAFTAAIEGDGAKRVTSAAWDKTAPLADGDFGAGLVTGRGGARNPVIVLRPSNLIVLECDTEEDLLAIEKLDLAPTLTVRSSAPYKRHFYFRPSPKLDHLPAVAFRFESGKLTADAGRYFLAPPALHPSGSVYAFLPDLGPNEVEIATLPDSVYQRLLEAASEHTTEQRHQLHVDPNAKVLPGKRRESIFRFACAQRRWTADENEILQLAMIWNEAHCEPPVSSDQVAMQVSGAMKMRGEQELARALEPPPPLPEEPWLPEPERDWDDGLYVVDEDTALEDSWRPVNLATLPERPPLEPTLGQLGIVYPGKRHVFSGPQESAKTLAAYAIGLQVVRQGGDLILIDFEMGAWDARNRLRELGATDQDLAHVHYIEPSEPATSDTAGRLLELKPELCIIDAAAGAYDLQGLDDNKRADVERFTRLYVRDFWRAGTATIVLDHVVKSTEGRGNYAIGSERKVGGADVHLGFEVIEAIKRGGKGLYKIVTHKDRGGFLKRGKLAEFELHSDPETHAIDWEFKGELPATDRPWRPTHLMEKVSRYVEARTAPVTRNTIDKDITGKRDYMLKAVDALLAEGYLTETDHGLSSVTKYREENEPAIQEARVPAVPGGSRDESSQDEGVTNSGTTETSQKTPLSEGGSLVPGGSQVVPGTTGSLVPPPTGGTSTGTPEKQGHWFPALADDDSIPF